MSEEDLLSEEKLLRSVLNDFTGKDFEIFVTTIYALSNEPQRKVWLNVIRYLLLKVSEKRNKSEKDEL